MDNVCFEVKVSEMYFPTIWRAKFTDLINSEKLNFGGKNGCRQKCMDKENYFSICFTVKLIRTI